MTLGINTQQVGRVRFKSCDHSRTSYKRKTDSHIFRSKLGPGKKKKSRILKFCLSCSNPVYLQISDGFVFVDVSPLSLLKYTFFLSIPIHPPFFISVPQTQHHLRSMWKKIFEMDSQVFICLHKYAFMYCFLVGNSTPAVLKEYHQAGIIFLFLQEQPQKEENESLCV